SAPSRRSPKRAFTSTTTSTFSGRFSPRRRRSSGSGPTAGASSTTETEGNVAAGTFEGGAAAAVLAGQTRLGRLGRVTDIAPLAVFLASDESAWITGEVIRAADGLVVAT